MSYCRFENTLADLQDCYENMGNVLSKTELQCKQKLIELCQTITQEFGETE